MHYTSFRGRPVLQSLTDEDDQQLLIIERTTSTVTLRFFPQGEAEVAEFIMQLDGNEQVSDLILPVPEQARWSFEYGQRNGYRFITQATTPTGAVEHLRYDDGGHAFPIQAGRANLPRVTQHTVEPGQGQPAMVTRYDYQVEIGGRQVDHNFLGGGQDGMSWVDDGLDNVFRADRTYQYGSEQHLMDGEKAVRVIRQVFNAFHLMELQLTEQNGHMYREEKVYNIDLDKPFADQPGNCQQVKDSVNHWRSPAGTRLERVTTDFDDWGNLLAQTDAAGVKTEHTYYPAEGEAGRCPKDPHGFVRTLRSTTVIPAQGVLIEGEAPVRVQHFFHELFPVLPSSNQPGWLAQVREERALLGHEATPYQVVAQSWYADPQADGADAFARLKAQSTTTYDLTTSTGISYTVPREFPDEPPTVTVAFSYRLEDSAWLPRSVLKTTSLTTGFGDEQRGIERAQREVNQEHSVLTGQVLLERDDNDVEVRYRYDALQRLVEQVLAPETEDQTSQLYTYGLATAGEPAWQVQEDAQGVQLTTCVDGLARAVQQWRAEPGAAFRAEPGKLPAERGAQVYEAHYDVLGQKARETLFDDCKTAKEPGQWEALALTAHFEYDDWGAERVQVTPDGVRNVNESDPIGDTHLPCTRSWQEVVADKPATAVITTVNNLFGQPVSVVRKGDDGVDDKTTYGYDGLGRKTRETKPWGHLSNRTTLFEFDVFDRDSARTLAGVARVERQYAFHSGEDLPETIDLDGVRLGTQTFDGLDRMVASETGGRKRTMTYENSLTRPSSVVTPKLHTIEYEYQPRLQDEPIRRRTGSDAEEQYDYDPKTALLMACHQEAVEVMSRTYFTNGQLKTEKRSLDGADYQMEYHYSVGKRLLQYTDVVQSTQQYLYDSAGRLTSSVIGKLTRPPLGQSASQWLADTSVGQVLDMLPELLEGKRPRSLRETLTPELTCTLTYDSLGRPLKVHTVDHQQANEPYLSTELAYDSLGREVERRFDIDGVPSVLSQQYDDADCITQRRLTEKGELLREELYEYDSFGHLSFYECTGPECPIDPYGKTISSQLFEVDALDNHTYVTTAWTLEATEQLRDFHRQLRDAQVTVEQLRTRVTAEGYNLATYHYDNELDPAQLSRIENDNVEAGYPALIQLRYDADGNLISDDAGRSLEYDHLGRLVSVSALADETPSIYHYDPTDIISGRSGGVEPEHRFYRDGQLATLVEGDKHVAIVRAGDHLIAERDNQSEYGNGPVRKWPHAAVKANLPPPTIPAEAYADTDGTLLTRAWQDGLRVSHVGWSASYPPGERIWSPSRSTMTTVQAAMRSGSLWAGPIL
ncbi:hypothetical protein [Pseudomonas sp. KNUC1026]|uniref:hypothetical protein n=1 Tax=Pseudomonas sp. KNUC1026 TaxID=2893890 RepID=UPI001F1CC5D6|nr:hypothetical protein [Pseudomonas sp. KNUC1026]UFH48278.1 hypothetical protein LN139_14000 [Pseudomonas sp. KNUC1026]